METEQRKRKAEDITPPTDKDDGDATTGKDNPPTQDDDKEQTVKRTKVLSLQDNKPVQEKSETVSEKEEEEAVDSGEKKSEETTDEAAPTASESACTPVAEDAPDNNASLQTNGKEETKSVFGAATGFSGFAAVKGGEGFGGKSDATSSVFGGGGGGFGSSTPGSSFFASGGKSGFANLSAGSARGFGELQGSSNSAFGASAAKKGEDDNTPADSTETSEPDPIRPIVELPTNYEIRSGEEEEIVLFEARCRTHRLLPAGSKNESTANSTAASATASKAAPAVPPSQSLVGNSTTDSTTSSSSTEITWQEVGTGPLKILQHVKSRKIRLVQRREVSPSGPATKVIVNAPLHLEGLTKIHHPTEKHVQWTTPVEGKAVTYLFKFGSPQDATELAKVLQSSQKSDNEVTK